MGPFPEGVSPLLAPRVPSSPRTARPGCRRPRTARPLRALPACQFWPPAVERPASRARTPPAKQPPARAVSARSRAEAAPEPASPADRIRTHLERLWEHGGVPEWHRVLYTARYLQGGFRPDFLQREAKALAAGTALVQRAMRAVEAREEVLGTLASFRSQHSDCELKVNRAPARARLLELLLALRSASGEVVEAVSAWRRSVAPLPGHGPSACSTKPSGHSGVETDQVSSPSVASPNARGACWPFGADGKDYLRHLAHDDSVVRSFDAVLELAPSCDPLLLFAPTALSAGGAPPPAPGKLRIPPLETSRRERFESMRMLLLEEELALELLSNKSVPAKSRPPPHRLGRGVGRASTMPVHTSSTSQAHQNESTKERSHSSTHKEHGHSGRPGSSRRSCSDALEKRQRTLKLAKLKTGLASILIPHHFGFSAMAITREQDSQETLKRLFNQMGEQAREAQTTQQSNCGRSESVSVSQRRRSSVSSTHSSRRGSMNADMLGGMPIRRSSNSGILRPRGRRTTSQGGRSGGGRAAVTDIMDHGVPAIDHLRIDAAFGRFAHDGQLHRDELQDALRRAGFTHPNEAWLDEAYTGVTTFTTMSLDEFSTVVMAYEARQRLFCLELFRGSNPEGRGNGLRSSVQVAEILRRMDLHPMPHVLAEVVREVDEDADGQITFGEFYRLVVMLREREGFTRLEYEELTDIFRRFDYSGCSEMPTRDLHHALLYLGFRASVDEVEHFMEEVDVDNDGVLDQSEFLYCMRRVRDCEVEHVRELMEAADSDDNGHISEDEMQYLLEDLGYYMPDDRIISEVFEEVGDRMEVAENNELDVGGVWQFLRIYRMREGLSREEAQEVEEAFERFSSHSGNETGEVSKRDLPKVLHYLGYRTSYEQQLLLAAEVDIDHSGALCLGELRKLVRMCREERLRAMKAAFDKFDPFNAGTLPVCKARLALGNIAGCMIEDLPESEQQDEIHEHFLNGTPVPLRTFMRTALWAEEAARHHFRESEGYSMDELAALRRHFEEFEACSTGCVNTTDLVGVITAASPGIASECPKLRPQLMEIIREATRHKADSPDSNIITFPEFLQLMRSVREMVHKEQLSKERQAMERSGFSPSEVHQFRSIFLSWANEHQRLPRQVFQEMLAPLCPHGGRSAAALANLWRRQFIDDGSHGCEDMTHGDYSPKSGICSEEADFSQFLQLMRAVLDANLGNMLATSFQSSRGSLKDSRKTVFPAGFQTGGASVAASEVSPPNSPSSRLGALRRSSLRLSAGLGVRQSMCES